MTASRKRFLPTLLLILISILLLACSDSATSPEPEDLTLEEAEETFLQFLKDRDYFSSDYFDDPPAGALEDGLPPVPREYIDSRMGDSGHILLNLFVTEEGIIVPNLEWRNENENFCMEQYRYMRAPVRMVQVRIDPTVRIVFVRVVDMATSEVLKMREGEGNGDNWLDEAIGEAWDKVENLNVEQAKDPCSGEIEMELVFDSRIEVQPPDDEYLISKVRSVIPLTYSKESDSYSGKAPLEHENYAIWLEESFSCSYKLDSGTQDATVNFPAVGVSYSSDIVATLGPKTSGEAPSASWSCNGSMWTEAPVWFPNFVLVHQQQVTEEGFEFTGWEEVDDPWVTAERTFERSQSVMSEDYVVKEETTIRLRHAEGN